MTTKRRERDATTADPLRILDARASDLVAKLERCLPPVDQHRTELERVRSQLAAMRRAGAERRIGKTDRLTELGVDGGYSAR